MLQPSETPYPNACTQGFKPGFSMEAILFLLKLLPENTVTEFIEKPIFKGENGVFADLINGVTDLFVHLAFLYTSSLKL